MTAGGGVLAQGFVFVVEKVHVSSIRPATRGGCLLGPFFCFVCFCPAPVFCVLCLWLRFVSWGVESRRAKTPRMLWESRALEQEWAPEHFIFAGLSIFDLRAHAVWVEDVALSVFASLPPLVYLPLSPSQVHMYAFRDLGVK